nr:integrase, catalytic region, zinc finger, CCHC-type, peptidase aspartic, catalytic [Tanacetum cinerariifolium]
DLGTTLVAVTPKNKTKQIRCTTQITKSERTTVATSPSANIDSNTPVLSSTGVTLKFLGTVKFGNDHVAKIMGYGEYQIGNVIIFRVYYVEGLGHNLFSVGQFCDSDLEVTFRQHTCFIRNLEGVDLLTGESLVITALKVQLNKLKGKAVLSEAVSLNPIDPELLKVDVAPLVPKLRENRTAHTDYIRHTQEEAATLRKSLKVRDFLVHLIHP